MAFCECFDCTLKEIRSTLNGRFPAVLPVLIEKLLSVNHILSGDEARSVGNGGGDEMCFAMRILILLQDSEDVVNAAICMYHV